jgi:hypothetical protein
MERHEILEAVEELKLCGMRASFDEITRLPLRPPQGTRRVMSCASGQPTPSRRCRTSRESHKIVAPHPVHSQNLHLTGVAIGREKGVAVESELTPYGFISIIFAFRIMCFSPSTICARLPDGERGRASANPAIRYLSGRVRSCSRRCPSHVTPQLCRHALPLWLPQRRKAAAAVHQDAARSPRCVSGVNFYQSSPALRQSVENGNPTPPHLKQDSIQLFTDGTFAAAASSPFLAFRSAFVAFPCPLSSSSALASLFTAPVSISRA